MKHKNRIIALMLTLIVCIGAFLIPAAAYSEEEGSLNEEDTEVIAFTEEEPSEEPAEEPAPEETPVEEPIQEPEPEPTPVEVAPVAVINESGLTPEGNLTLVDDYGSATGEGKQFITLVTKSGNYFYLIIDRDADGNNTVHFLNQVDEADLLSLMDEEMANEYLTDIEESQAPEPDPEVTEPSATPTPEEPEPTTKTNVLPSLILLGVVAAGGIGFAVTRIRNKKAAQQIRPDPDGDYAMHGGYAFPEEDMDESEE